MLVIELCLWVNVFGTIQGVLHFSVTSSSERPYICILDGEETAVITCTITPSTTTSVIWEKNSISQAVCLHTGDICVPKSSDRYNFTSDYQMYQFFFTISDVTLGIDEGIYTCAEGMTRESINISVCQVPTNVTISETGTGTVTVTGTSDCVFPYSDITFEWFYVPVMSHRNETNEIELNITANKNSSVSGCMNGARTVISSFQYDNSSAKHTQEVKFLVKVSHPALASPVEAKTKYTYLLDQGEDSTARPNGNQVNIGDVIGAVFGSVVAGALFVGAIALICIICSVKKIPNVQIVLLAKTYDLTWSALDNAKFYFIMWRDPKKDWKVFAIVNHSQTSYRVYSCQHEWKILVETKDGKIIDLDNAQEKSKTTPDDKKVRIKIAPENDKYILKWIVPNDISTLVKQYQVWRKEPGTSWEKIEDVSSDVTYYTVDYKWTVQVEGNVDTRVEAPATASRGKLPPVSHQFTLKWTTPTGIDVTRYHIFRQNNKGVETETAALHKNENCFTLNYQWKIVAELFDGHFDMDPEVKKPNAVDKRKRASENETYVLKWTAPNDISKKVRQYYIMRKENGCKWTEIDVVSKDKTQYTVKYCWTVKVEGNVVTEPFEAPATASSDKLTLLSNNQTLRWATPTGMKVTRYKILRQDNKGAKKEIAILPKNVKCYTLYYKWKIVAEQHKTLDIGVASERKKTPVHLECKSAPDNEFGFWLQWSAPTVQGELLNYVVWRKKHESTSDWEKKATLLTSQTRYAIENKEDDWKISTEYKHSENIGQAELAGSIPLGQVQFSIAHDEHCKNLFLHWKKPNNIDILTSMGDFQIWWNEIGIKEKRTIIDVPKNTSTYHFRNRKPNEKYEIGVHVRNSKGYGLMVLKPSGKEKPSATRSLELIYNEGKCVRLTWDPPGFPILSEIKTYYIWKKDKPKEKEKDKAPTDWQLYCVVDPWKQSRQLLETFDTGKQSIEAEELPAEKCDFLISAANNYGIGDLLDTVIGKENYGTPGRPTNITVFKSQSNSRTVTWDPPSDCGLSLIKKYQVLIIKCDGKFNRLHDDSSFAKYKKCQMAENGSYVRAFVPWNIMKYSVPTDYSSPTEGFVCSICAYNDEGRGKSSYFISTQTGNSDTENRQQGAKVYPEGNSNGQYDLNV